MLQFIAFYAFTIAFIVQIGDSKSTIVKFWIDEFAFGDGETNLLRSEIESSNGAASLTGETLAPFLTTKGYQTLPAFDIYWTGRQGCYQAFKYDLLNTHIISCSPGTESITKKARLVSTLLTAFGDVAFSIIPLTYRLPQDYFQLVDRIKKENSSSWALKRDVHRGKGVSLVQGDEVLKQSLKRDEKGNQINILAQRMIESQYLINNRPFYIRVWAVITGLHPLRAYLYDGGVVVFGSEQGREDSSMLVNLWTQDRKAASPWGLFQLRNHLGKDAFDKVWAHMLNQTAMTFASALPAMERSTNRSAPGFQGGNFEVLGLDFIVDDSFQPWLLEVNWLPSLARKVLNCTEHCQLDNPFDKEKEQFVHAMFELLIGKHGLIQKYTATNETLAMVSEEAKMATDLGYHNLTPKMYAALRCMIERNKCESVYDDTNIQKQKDRLNENEDFGSSRWPLLQPLQWHLAYQRAPAQQPFVDASDATRHWVKTLADG